jgi:RHS repeat-associated protein
VKLTLSTFDPNGVPLLNAIDVAAGTTPILDANPVVAALGGGTYAVAWTDFGGDGDELGIAMRTVDATTGTLGPLGYANSATAFSQYDPDILRVGSTVVVAWMDDTDAINGPDLEVRTFDTNLAPPPKSPEVALAASPDAEGNVALAPFEGSWAAAWRADASGLETLHAKAGSVSWTVGPIVGGPADDKPGLAELDATHLLLVFTEETDPLSTGVPSVPRLRGAILDTSHPGETSYFGNQRFDYRWDEVGRLVEALRWDGAPGDITTIPPDNTADAHLKYTYDAGDDRVVKEAIDRTGLSRYTVYLFSTLELRRASWLSDHYEDDASTEVAYLSAHGVTLGRLWYEPDTSVPTNGAGKLHVFYQLGDQLGSTSVVLDQSTGELVERTTFEGYGATESDYRPSRWNAYRADKRFTGKEEDVEVGLYYFGKRYLNPFLGRWVSADPLAVQARGNTDLNLYAYVRGRVLQNIDPLGLQEAPKPPPDATYHVYSHFGAGGKASNVKRGDGAKPKPAPSAAPSAPKPQNKDDPLSHFDGNGPTPAGTGPSDTGDLPTGPPGGSSGPRGSGSCHGLECSGYGKRKNDTLMDQLMSGFDLFFLGISPGKSGESGGMPGGHGPSGGGSSWLQMLVVAGAVLSDRAASALADAIQSGVRALSEGLEDLGRRLPKSEIAKPPARRGDAPIGSDGHPVELHHRGQRPDSPLDEMTRTEHRGKGNFARNHANTGQEPSKIDRGAFRKQRRGHWNEEWDRGRFKDDDGD